MADNRNEQARRGIGKTNEAGRRGIGATNETARRAIGQRLQTERRGSAVQDDLNSLIRPERQRKQLRAVEARGAVPVQRGRADWKPPAATTPGGGGIASPLTEKTMVEGSNTVPDRAYYADTSLISSDGLFTFVVRPIKTLNFTDANSVDSQVQLAAPSVAVTP